MPTNIWRVGVRRMGPSSFQWCPVTGQGATSTNWSIECSVWTWGRTSSLWGWWSPGTGCPGRLWNLFLWRYSRPTWMRSCAAFSRWICFDRGVGLEDPQRSLLTPTILWFCDDYCHTNLPDLYLADLVAWCSVVSGRFSWQQHHKGFNWHSPHHWRYSPCVSSPANKEQSLHICLFWEPMLSRNCLQRIK